MMPTRTHYFFANDWPLRWLFILFLFGLPLLFAYRVAMVLIGVYEPLSDVWNVLRLGFYVVVALLFSFLLAFVMSSILAGIFSPLVRPLYKARCAKNGAPFHAGDRVRILTGPHKGKIARVYSEWQHDSVRVELGEKEREKFKDIFDPLQLLREDVEPDAAREPPHAAPVQDASEPMNPKPQSEAPADSGGR